MLSQILPLYTFPLQVTSRKLFRNEALVKAAGVGLDVLHSWGLRWSNARHVIRSRYNVCMGNAMTQGEDWICYMYRILLRQGGTAA